MDWLRENYNTLEIIGVLGLWLAIMIYLRYQTRPVDWGKRLEKMRDRLKSLGLSLDEPRMGLCALFHTNYSIMRTRANLFLYGALTSLGVLLILLLKSLRSSTVDDAHLVGAMLSRAIPSAIALFAVGLFIRQHRYYIKLGDFFLSRYHGILMSSLVDGGTNVDQWMERFYPRIDMGIVKVPTEQIDSVIAGLKK